MVIAATLVGLAGAGGAVVFRLMIRSVQSIAWGDGLGQVIEEGLLVEAVDPLDRVRALEWWWRLSIPAIGGLIVGPFIYFFAREARGHGVPEVMKAVATRGGIIRVRVVFAKAIASAAGRLVRSLGSKPIVITSTGRAAFEVSRYRPDQDILVFSHDETVLRRLSLGWGLYPVDVIPPERDVARLVSMLIQGALESNLVMEEDVVTIVHGYLPGVSGTTNTIQVLDVKEFLSSGLA